MKTKKGKKKRGFSIVELLTVMSIIVILMGLVLPALNLVRRHARRVRQKAQFHSVSVAMELFNTEWDGYPESSDNSYSGSSGSGVYPYCGAMKLAEALLGQDLLGFNPQSLFYADGTDGAGYDFYPANPGKTDIELRKPPYLQLENAEAYRMENIYSDPSPYRTDSLVLCDVYKNVKNLKSGTTKIGVPLLYYKANASNFKHDPNLPNNTANIYDYRDNHKLVQLGAPWNVSVPSAADHPLSVITPKGVFYENTLDKNITAMCRPHRADSYILISAGFDGLYGTDDDVCNFGE